MKSITAHACGMLICTSNHARVYRERKYGLINKGTGKEDGTCSARLCSPLDA